MLLAWVMAPYIVLSPTTQLLHYAADEDAVKDLCKQENITHRNMRNMLGLPAATEAGVRKKHVDNWVMPERLRFIRREGCPDILAVIGGDAQYYINNYTRPDMAGFSSHRLNELLNSRDGLVKSDNKRAPYNPAGWLWRRVMDPPAIEEILEFFKWAPAPWAPPKVSPLSPLSPLAPSAPLLHPHPREHVRARAHTPPPPRRARALALCPFCGFPRRGAVHFEGSRQWHARPPPHHFACCF